MNKQREWTTRRGTSRRVAGWIAGAMTARRQGTGGNRATVVARLSICWLGVPSAWSSGMVFTFEQ